MIGNAANKQKPESKQNTLLCIDYGSTNIGLAFGRNGFVSPLKVISGKNASTAIHEISRLVRQNQIEKIVMGLPLGADGKETRQSLEVRKFAKLLKVLTKKQIAFQNEHSSTQEAIKSAISSGMSQRRRYVTDHLSAAIILKNYYNENS